MFPGQSHVDRAFDFGGEDRHGLERIESSIEDGVDVLTGKDSPRLNSQVAQRSQDSLDRTLILAGKEITGDLSEATTTEPLVRLLLGCPKHQVPWNALGTVKKPQIEDVGEVFHVSAP